MTNKFYWGNDITYTLKVVDPADHSALLDMSGVTDAPTIYVYSEKPSRDQAANGTGTGLIETITSWSDNADGGKDFTITAIDDPDTDDIEGREVYWLGINFTLKNSEQTQTIVRALPMRRAYVAHDGHGVTQTVLESYYAPIAQHRSASEITAAINVAERDVKNDLSAIGYNTALLWCQGDLKESIAYRALGLLCESLVVDTGDRWDSRGDFYNDMSSKTLNSVRLYIADIDNQEPVKLETPDTESIFFTR